MGQSREAITQNLAERLCWQAAHRDDARVARRLYRKQVVDGVYQLDEGAVLDDFFHFLRQLGVLALMGGVQGKALQREMVPVTPYLLL
jgi:NADPH:quinone reductase-like Zn-dependent oxidoreductase